VGEARISRPPPDADDPFPEDGGVDKRIAPQHMRDALIVVDEVTHGLVRNQRHLGRDQCREIVVHHLDEQPLQIGDVAGDVERHDLPAARWHGGVAARESFNDKADDRRPVAFANDILVGAKHLDGRPQAGERAVFGLSGI
jgi:hypothetical protein